MVLIRTFCCCCNTRSGTLFSAFYAIFMSVICMALSLMVFSSPAHRHIDYKGLEVFPYISFAVYTISVVLSFVNIAATHLENRHGLLPWVLWMFICIGYETTDTTFLVLQMLQHETAGNKWNIFSICFFSLRTVINIYCIVCVISYFQELCDWHRQGSDIYITKTIDQRDCKSVWINPSVSSSGTGNDRDLPPPPYSCDPPSYHSLCSMAAEEARVIMNRSISKDDTDMCWDIKSPASSAIANIERGCGAKDRAPLPRPPSTESSPTDCNKTRHASMQPRSSLPHTSALQFSG
eukprot:GHVU01088647.1.p1 GENE.GHVU01088647.1~~GHVU01088647.1.p1  ORF type:complete len:293 (+),score=5.20 GHVU01088647.1:637-1515(+)